MPAKRLQILRNRARVLAELLRIDATHEKLDGAGAIIVWDKARAYLSGIPYFLTADINSAFRFTNERQAREIVRRFRATLKGAKVLAFHKQPIITFHADHPEKFREFLAAHPEFLQACVNYARTKLKERRTK